MTATTPDRLPTDLVVASERTRYALLIVASLAIYGVLAWLVLTAPATGGVILFYAVLFSVLGFLAHGLALGRIRGNGVRVTVEQLPLLHRLVSSHAATLGLRKVPDVYVIESGGLLNAFATRFLGREFVIIHSDVLELALQEGEDAVGFVVAHELGHIWRGHLKYRWLTLPGRLTPYLGSAWSRSCEYTCDRVGAFCQPTGAVRGLLVLAAGKQVHLHVDPAVYADQATTDAGFWIRRAEVHSSHPRLPKRLAALIASGVPVPVRMESELGG